MEFLSYDKILVVFLHLFYPFIPPVAILPSLLYLPESPLVFYSIFPNEENSQKQEILMMHTKQK